MKKYFYFIILFFAYLLVPCASSATSPSSLVVFEFRTRTNSNYYDEYISIANFGSNSVNLENYALMKKAAGTVTNPGIPKLIHKYGSYSLEAGQIITVGGSGYSGNNFIPYNGTETLADTNNAIILTNNLGQVIDLVIYGSVIYPDTEGSSLSNPPKGAIYRRKHNPELNDNSLDFEIYTPPISVDPNASKLLITELMPAPSEGGEWIELFNPTNQQVSLFGFKLCDAMGSVHCYYFPQDAILNPLEYKIYSQTDTKITLNNTGDWVELRDLDDNLISDSGGDYGNSDSGISLALFGEEFRWTKTATPSAENIYTDTIEVESSTTISPKSTNKKVKKTVARAISTIKTTPDEETMESVAGASKTSGSTKDNAANGNEKNNSLLGYILITLAVLLFVGYNLWDQRDAIRNFYHKICRRDS